LSKSSIAANQFRLVEPIATSDVTVPRVRDEKDWERFKFDRDLYIQEFTKTQFAGADDHLKVIALLKPAQPYFKELGVEDEGEFRETGNVTIFRDHLEWYRL
jgi:hypothetical protein